MIEMIVISSGGFFSALQALIPVYEQKIGKKITLLSGSSMGPSPTSIPARLKSGEEADVIVMAGPELDKMIEDGFAAPGSRTDLVFSKIGMVVRSGEPQPDISSKDAFVRTVLDAKSLGYSASASGTYLAQELFPKLGLWEQIEEKSKLVVKDRVAEWVARGDLEIGFQQVSELLPIPGVDFVGALPDEVQKVTIFSAGLVANSKNIDEAKALLNFLTSPEADPIIIEKGLEPATPR